MPQNKKSLNNIDFLKLFKKSLAASLTIFIFGIQTSYATNINAGPGYNTNVSTDGNTTNITGGLINNGTGFHHFTDFDLSRGDIANLIFAQGADRYVNLVDNRVSIYGIFNSLKGGNIGGDVIFVSPMGMIVGASGIMNVGSLQTITPAQGTYNSLLGLGQGITYDNIGGLSSEGSTASVSIQGKVFASDKIDLSAGSNVMLGADSALVTGFNEDGFNKTKLPDVDMSEIVNDEGVVNAEFISDAGGDVKLYANNINASGGLIQSAGDVNLDARDGTITVASKVMSAQDVNIGANSAATTRRVTLNNDITAAGNVNITIDRDVTQNESSNIDAASVNYSASTLTVDGDINSKNGVTISSTEFVQGANSEILNTESGNISVSASTDIESNKITNQAQGGTVSLSGRDITLKDTVSSTDTINVSAQGDITQADDTFNAFDSGNDLNITADYNVGSSNQALNVNVANNVNVLGANSDIYLKSNDSDLNIATISNANNVNLDGSKKVNISQSVDAMESVNITSQEGFSQTADSSININGDSGNVTITNTGSGDVDVNNISNFGGNVVINNDSSSAPTPGNVNINGNIQADTGYVDIDSSGGYSQSGTINAYGADGTGSSVSIDAQGDVNAGQITGQENIAINGNNVTLSETIISDQGGVTVDAQGDVNTGEITAQDDINISGNNVQFSDLISSHQGGINVDAQGNISQTGSDKTLEASDDVTLNAGGDVGSENQTVVVSTENGSVKVDAAGGVNVTGQDTNIELGNITAGTDYNIITTGEGELIFNKDLSDVEGDLTFITDKDLNIDSQITATGDVTLTSNQGDIILNSIISSTEENVNLTAEGAIYHKDGYSDTSISAQKDINLTANSGDIGTFSGTDVSQAINLNAGGTVNAEGGNVALESSESLKVGNINSSKENPQTLVSIKTTGADNGNIDIAGMIKGSDISIDAAQNITQSTQGQSITASGDLSLISQTGSIGETDNAINFSAENVSASANSGSVVLKGIDTDIKTSQISAKDNIDLSTENTGADPEKGKIIIENDLTTQDGYISLNSAKNLEINNNISAGQSVTLGAQEGITQKENTTVTSGTSASAQDGSGNILITNETTGDISLQNVTANKGNISVVNNAAGSDIILNSVLNSTSSDVSLNSVGNILQSAVTDTASITAAGDIVLNAVNAGTSDNKIMVNADGSLYSTSDNLYVQDTEGDLTLGVLNIGQSADITANGNILQDSQDRDAIVSSGNININTTGSIGSTDNSLALNITGDGRLNAQASDIYLGGTSVSTGQINAANDLNINTVDKNGSVTIADNMTAGGNIDISSGGGVSHTGGIITRDDRNSGHINIGATNGDISLGNVVNNNGEINITGTENAADVVLNDVIQSAGGDINISTVGNIVQNGSNPSVSTDSDITFATQTGSVGSGENKLVVESTGGSVSADSGGSVYLTGQDTSINASDITAGNNIDLTVTGTGNINIDSALTTDNGYISLVTDNGIVIDNLISASEGVNLNAQGGSITQNSALDKAINAGTDITLSADGDIGSDGTNLSLNAAGSVTADGQNVYLTSPDADLNIASVTSGGVVNLKTDNAGNVNLGGLVTGTDVIINAADGVYQTGAGKTIDASGDLSLVAGKESVGQQGQAINFSANSVSAEAAKSVVLLGEDTDINTSSIKATENIDLTTRVTNPDSDKGVITVSNELNTTNGYIKLDSAKALNINENISAGQHITLNANGGIVQGSGTSITSGTSAAAQNGDINISNSGSGKIELTQVSSSKGGINISNNVESGDNADIVLGDITSVDGAVTITNSAADNDVILNSLVQSTGNNAGISITSNGAVIQSHDNLALNTTGNIILDTVTGAGSETQALKLGADGTLTAGGDEIYITSPEKSLNIAGITSTGTVNLDTLSDSANINIHGGISGGDITLTSGSGIYQTIDGQSITADGNLTLTAQNGSIGQKDKALTFKADKVTAQAAGGSVVLNGIDTDINTGSIIAGQDIDLTTTGSGNINVEDVVDAAGYVSLNSAQHLTLNHNINSDSYIELGASQGLTINSNIEAAGNVTVDTQGGVTQQSGSITSTGGGFSAENTGTGDINFNNITANKDVQITNTAQNAAVSVSGVTSQTGGVSFASSGNLSAENVTASGDIEISSNAQDASVTADTITSQAGNVNISSLQDITADAISAANNVVISNTNGAGTINAGGITSTNGFIDIDSSGELTVTDGGLTTNTGDITLDAAGNIIASTINAGGNVAISNAAGSGTINAGGITSTSGSIDIDSSGELTVTDGGLTTNTGDITLNAAEDVLLSSLVNSAGTVDIISAGSVLQNIANNGKAIQAGSDVNIEAVNNIGSLENALQINSNGSINADADSLYIANKEGGLNAGEITAQNNANLTASGNITQTAGGFVTANNINLNADGYQIGSNGNALNVNTSNAVNAKADDIYLTSENDLTTGRIDAQNTADITTTGEQTDITISNLVSADNVNINASGSVLQNSTLDKTIEAGNLNLTAQNGSIGETGNAIDFTASGNLQAAASQAVVLNSVGHDLNTSSVTAGTSIDLSTEGSGKITVSSDLNAQGGYIRLDSAEDLALNKDLTATDYIELASKGGNVTLDNSEITAGTYVDIDSNGSITQTNSMINAGTDVILNAVQNIGTSDSAIALNAKNDVTVENAVDVYLKSEDTLNIAGVNAAGTVNLDAAKAGNVNIKDEIKGNDVTISAADNIYQSMEGQAITASGDVVLNAAAGDIGQTDNAINVGADSVQASAVSGSVVLNAIDTDLNTNDITAGENIDLTTTGTGNINVQSNLDANGYIRLDSSNNLNLGQYNVTSDDYIYIGANNGITLDSNIDAQTGITIDSGAGISQNSGYINSASGDISVANNGANGINLNNVNAQGGSVVISALESASGDIVLDNVLAADDITVTNSSSGQSNVNLNDLTTSNGIIVVENTSGGDIELDSVLTAQNGTISLNADKGNITQSHSNASLVSGGDITLAANNVGSQTQYINTQSAANVNADGTNIYIESNQNGYNIGNINASGNYTNETVNIKSNSGNVILNGLTKGNAVTIDSANNVVQDSSLEKSIEAGTVTFNAQGGFIGTQDNRIDMSVTGAVNVPNADSVYLNGVDNGTDVAVNLGNINAENTVDVTSETGMRLNGLVDTKNAILTAQGDILQSEDTDLSIDADSIRLTSANGNIGATGDAIDFKTTDLQASAINGAVVLNGVDSSINTNRIEAGTNIDLSTTGSGDITIHDALTANGYIRLNAANSLNVNHDLTAQDYVELAARNGEVLLDSIISGTDVTVSATGGVEQTGGQIISSGSNGVNITNSQDGGINLTDIQAAGGQINITNDATASGDVVTGTLSANSGVNITNNSKTQADVVLNKITNTNGAVNIANTSGGDVELNNLVQSSGDININASTGDITQTFNGTSIDSGANVSLIAGNTIGTTNQKLLMNAGGNVSLEASNLYITSPDSNLNIVSINQNREDKTLGDVIIETTTGNLSVTDNITADNIDLDSAGTLNTTGDLLADTIDMMAALALTTGGNITGQTNVTISGKSVTQGANTTISSEEGSVLITAENGAAQVNNISGQTGVIVSGNSVSQGAGTTISSETGNVAITASSGNAQVNNISGNAGVNISGESVIQGDDTIISSEEGSVSITASETANVNNISGQTGVTVSGASITQGKGTTISSEEGNVLITASEAANVNNISGQTGVTVSGTVSGASVTQGEDTTISSAAGNISVMAQNGNIILNGALESAVGDVIVENNTTGNASVSVNDITAGNSFSVTNNANGLLTVNGTLTGGNDSSLLAQNTGDASGLLVNDTAVINNNGGTLSIYNAGAQGLNLGGQINNDLSDSSSVSITSDKGGLKLFADINNGTKTGDTNSVSIVNNGADADGNGLVFENGTINNYGNLTVQNNAGEMTLAGGINTYLGSVNSFINGADSDFIINTELENTGTTITFENSGTGSLIIGEDANLSVYSTQQGDNVYTGILNLVNSSTSGDGGGITINGTLNNGDGQTAGGIINITNDGNGGANDYGILLSENSVINNYAELNISNNSTNSNASGKIAINGTINGDKGPVLASDTAPVPGNVINITNNAQGENSSIEFGENSKTNAGANVINITNNGEGGITFNENSQLTNSANLTITNNKGSLNVNNGALVSSSSDVMLYNRESGNSVNVNGQIHGANVTLQSTGSDVNIAHNTTKGNITADKDINITVSNADIVNTSAAQNQQAQGISAGGNVVLSADNIGQVDSIDVVADGFNNVNPDNAIHVTSGGKVTANAFGDINLLSPEGDLNINTLSAQNALLGAVNGDITASSLSASGNLYLNAQSDSSNISIDDVSAGLLSAEAGNNITINSTQGLDIESILSRNGSVKIDTDGNTYIREIAAANDVTVNVDDEKLTVVNLGRVDRNPDIIPSTINLTVTDAKNTSENKNSKLDIYNGYAQDKVTLKADTITAQVYDISESAQKGDIRHDSKYGIEATGFHNANKNGGLLNFDIQGANYEQKDVGSNPHNPNYQPDENDKHALSVHLTLGDSVGDAVYGANFEKLYSDYAFIDSINKSDPAAFSKLVIGSGIIGDYAIFRNNQYRLDINNNGATEDIVESYPINKHYDDAPDRTVNNTTSFTAQIFDSIIIEDPYNPSYPLDPVTGQVYNPHRNIKDPDLAKKTKQVSAKGDDNSAVDTEASTGLRQISWVVRNSNDDILGASDIDTLHNPVVDSLLAVSQKGIIVTADTLSENGLKKGQKVGIDLRYKDIDFTVDGIVNTISGRTVEIGFVNIDKLTSTVILFLQMYQENL